MEWQRDNFLISDDKNRLPILEVVRLHRQIYDFSAYSEDLVFQLLGNCFWLGLYNGDQLVGFARAVTDTKTFSYLCDFIIDSRYQRQSLGSWLMKCFIQHPNICKTTIGLGTQDADAFYQKFDFERTSTMRRLSRD
jgi:GNAT superfamily N-acetyltransferase